MTIFKAIPQVPVFDDSALTDFCVAIKQRLEVYQGNIGNGSDVVLHNELAELTETIGDNDNFQIGTEMLMSNYWNAVIVGDSNNYDFILFDKSQKEPWIIALHNQGVSQYYDGNKKTETTSFGGEITGQIKITGGAPGLGKILMSDEEGLASWGFGGDVVGPPFATNNAIVLFDDSGGKLIKNSLITVDFSGAPTFPSNTALRWRDSGGTQRNVLAYNAADDIVIGAVDDDANIYFDRPRLASLASPLQDSRRFSIAASYWKSGIENKRMATIWHEIFTDNPLSHLNFGIGPDGAENKIMSLEDNNGTLLAIFNSTVKIDDMHLRNDGVYNRIDLHGSDDFLLYDLANSKDIISVARNGAITLYDDGASKFFTSAAGATIQGTVTITGGSPGVNKVLTSDASGLASWQTPSGGISGPGSSTDRAIALWSGTDGSALLDSPILIDSSGHLIVGNHQIRLDNAQNIVWRNAANSAWIVGLHVSSLDNTHVGSAGDEVLIGEGCSSSNPVHIRVNATNNKQLTVGAANSGGSGWRMIRVSN